MDRAARNLSGPKLFALYFLVHGALAWWFIAGSVEVGPGASEGFPLDDAWIHMVYARSFATGGGFAYNPGEAEAGFTSLLWVVVLAPTVWLGKLVGTTVWWVKLWGVACASAACLFAHLILRELSARESAAWLAGLCVCFDPGLAFAQISGMEVPLAIACMLAGALGLLRKDPRLAGLGLAFAALTRPELAVWTSLGVAAFAYELYRARKGSEAEGLRPASARDLLWLVLPSAIGGSSWIAYCLYATGRPLPNTFYAKFSTLESDFGQSLEVIFTQMLPRMPSVAVGICLVAIGAGMLHLLRANDHHPWPLRATLALYPIVFAVLLARAHQLVEGDAYYWARYVQPIVGLIIILIVLGLDQLWGAPDDGRARELRVAGRVLCCVHLGIALLMTVPRMLEDRHRYATDSQNIHEMQVFVGKQLAEHTAATDIIASVDAGAVRYFSDRKVIDIRGLNHHEVLRDGFSAVEQRLEPRFSVLFRREFVQLPADGNRRLVQTAEAEEYTLCRCDQEVLFVVERAWSDEDKN